MSLTIVASFGNDHSMFSRLLPLVVGMLALFFLKASAAITPGLLSDFEDGTTQSWSGNSNPTNIANGGPLGAGDNFLQIGGGNRFATFNLTGSYSGIVDSSVTGFQVDMMRPFGEGAIEMRLVMFGPGAGNAADRWTSSTAFTVPDDGNWATYTFSLAEADLSQVLGSDTYANMLLDVDRVMFRYDPGTPSATGVSNTGTLGIDNVTAVPEPAAYVAIFGLFGWCFAAYRRRKT